MSNVHPTFAAILAPLVSPVMPPEIAAKLQSKQPQIRVPPVPTMQQRIGKLSKILIDLADDIDEIKFQDRHHYDTLRTDMEAAMDDMESEAKRIDESATGEERRRRAAHEQADKDATERALFMFGKSIK
jgi:hypothetical protein